MSMSIGRFAFCTGCVATLAISAVYPAWGAIQQSEAYGGYVDMALVSLGLPSNAIPGVSTSLPLRVHNHGPETAEFPQVLFSGDYRLTPSSSMGCLDSPAPEPRCRLAPLAPGESRVVDFVWDVPPSARGTLTLGAVALSEAIDIQSGNEMMLAAPHTDPFIDLGLYAENERPLIDASGNLRWVIRFRNTGPSASLAPTSTPSLWPQPVSMTCQATFGSFCGGSTLNAFLAPRGELIYEIVFPPLSADVPYIAIVMNAMAQAADEREMNPADNHLSIEYHSGLFAGDFE